MSKEIEKTPKQKVLEILAVNKFTETDDLTHLLIANGMWADKDPAEMIFAFQKSETRKWLKTLKDEHGRPAFANIEIENEAGETVHVYMQPYLFDIEQFKQVINYHISKTKYHANEAKEFQKELQSKYNVQYELPFKLE